MTLLVESFEDRLQDINEYLDLLDALEAGIREGERSIGAYAITVRQQKILNAGVYLQLYNLVEATATKCISIVTDAVTTNGSRLPADLNEQLRCEWIRTKARTHVDMSSENRLKAAVILCGNLINKLPITDLAIDKGGGGNWDATEFEKITKRLGCNLRLSRAARNAVRSPFYNGKGALEAVKDFRNKLAHGELSFSECGAGSSARDLRDITDKISLYLREVIKSFQSYIDSESFLLT